MQIEHWLPFDPNKISTHTLLVPEVLIWLVGIVFLCAGARLYRLALMSPGFAIGALLAVEYGGALSKEIQLGVTVVVGIIGAVVLMTLEKLAIALTGALAFVGLLYAATPLVFATGVAPWYAPAIAALLGSFFFPMLYKKLLPILTPLAGALCICWAINKLQEPYIVGGLWVVGALIQLVSYKAPDKNKE